MAGNDAAALLGMTDIVKRFPGVRRARRGRPRRPARRGALPARPERRRQVDAHQGPRRRAPARRGRHHLAGRGRCASATPRPRCDLGIATIYQELDLVDGLTVAENIYLGHEKSRFGFSQRRAADRAAAARCSSASATPRSRRPARSARSRAAGQQIVSMARALSHDARLIVMDEPSAVLDAGEVKRPLPRHPRPHRRRRRRRLHLAPARGDPHDRRPDHGAQGRPHRRHRAACHGDPDRRASSG